ncbi:AMP-binding protein, partial [Xanthomonas albilineans]|uniref:AMP-binding protein n=1 Tax=Xanthomonas albilineans TaxID=29447 RepID=UPI003CCCC769
MPRRCSSMRRWSGGWAIGGICWWRWWPRVPKIWRRLPLLDEAERHQVLTEWNATAADYPRDACVHELFEAQVVRDPSAIAVVQGEVSLTYAELNARANRLAHYLRGLGVRPDDRVAICVQRSVEMVVALLAVLKAGGAYVPLDPAYPPERLAYMQSDCGA